MPRRVRDTKTSSVIPGSLVALAPWNDGKEGLAFSFAIG
jgi:hypothetical protein